MLTWRALGDKLKLSYFTFINQVQAGSARVPPENLIGRDRVLRVDHKGVREETTELLRFAHISSDLWDKR